MKRVTLRIPAEQVAAIDELAAAGAFPNRSEAIRAAIRAFLAERPEPADRVATIEPGPKNYSRFRGGEG